MEDPDAQRFIIKAGSSIGFESTVCSFPETQLPATKFDLSAMNFLILPSSPSRYGLSWQYGIISVLGISHHHHLAEEPCCASISGKPFLRFNFTGAHWYNLSGRFPPRRSITLKFRNSPSRFCSIFSLLFIRYFINRSSENMSNRCCLYIVSLSLSPCFSADRRKSRIFPLMWFKIYTLPDTSIYLCKYTHGLDVSGSTRAHAFTTIKIHT